MKNYYWYLITLVIGIVIGFYICHGCNKPIESTPIVITQKAIHDSFIVYVDSSKGKLSVVNKWLAIKDKENAKISADLKQSRASEAKAWDYVNILQNPSKTTLDSLKELANLNNENCDLLVTGLERVITLKDESISIKDTLQAKTVNLLDSAIKRGNTWEANSRKVNLSLAREKVNKKFWRIATAVAAIGGFYLGVKTK